MTSMSYKPIQTKTASVFSWSQVTKKVRDTGFYHLFHAPFSSLNAKRNKMSQFPLLLCHCASLHLTMWSLTAQQDLYFYPSYHPSSAWEAQMGEYDLCAREQHPSFLYLKSYKSYLPPSSSTHLSHWHFLPYYYLCFFTQILAPAQHRL